jgi:hypothetical protein
MKKAFSGVITFLALASIVVGSSVSASASSGWSQASYLTSESSEPVDQIVNRSALVATSSEGRFVSLWSRTQGADLMVQASTSTDGVTWSTPVNLSANGNNSYRSEISVTPDGRFIALWRMVVGGFEIVYLSHSTDGETWSTPTALSGSGYNSTNPRVASDTSGRTIVVWDMDDGVNEQIEVVMTSDFLQWTSPNRIPLSTGAARDNLPEVSASVEEGFAIVFYSHTSNYQRVAAVSSTDGTTWSAPHFLSGQNDGYAPLITTTSQGDFLSLWVQNGVVYSAIGSTGNSWSSTRELSSNGCRPQQPSLSRSLDGSISAIWVCFSNSVWSVETATSNDGTTWEAPESIYSSSSTISWPQIARGIHGEQSAAWTLQDNQDYSTLAIAQPIGEQWGTVQTLSSPGSISLTVATASNDRGVLLTLWDEAITADWQVPPLYWRVSSSIFSYDLPQTPISPDMSVAPEELAVTGLVQEHILSYGMLLVVFGLFLASVGMSTRSRYNKTKVRD